MKLHNIVLHVGFEVGRSKKGSTQRKFPASREGGGELSKECLKFAWDVQRGGRGVGPFREI